MSYHNKIQNALNFGLILGLTSGLTVWAGSYLCQKQEVEEVGEVLTSIIMKEKEEKLGIKFNSAPNVKAAYVGDHFAMYVPKTNTILLDINYEFPPDFNLEDMTTYEDIPDIYFKEMLEHELGHFYADELAQKRGVEAWPLSQLDLIVKREEEILYPSQLSGEIIMEYSLEFKQRNMNALTEAFLVYAISEGIGRYFQFDGKEEAKFQDSNWPKDITEIEGEESRYFIYDGGYSIVKPIIDLYGGEGIDYLIQNPPTFTNLRMLPEYRYNALQELKQRSKAEE